MPGGAGSRPATKHHIGGSSLNTLTEVSTPTKEQPFLTACGEQDERAFNEFDTDGDRRLTRDEWVHLVGNDDLFDAYDVDGNGAHGTRHRSMVIAACSVGSISPEEWLAAQQVPMCGARDAGTKSGCDHRF